MQKLSHIDPHGRAAMVNITEKKETKRVAIAKGRIYMMPETLALIDAGGVKKGEVYSIARIAGIMAAKKTAELIPLCHPLPIQSVSIDLISNTSENCIDIQATASLYGRTGIEMEALTAVSISALVIFDMCKAVDKKMKVSDVRLIHKSGGKSGTFNAD
ncbi:MAG: cyclic pyranopterin monophosphate synthase MoaC [Kordiimonadaceae bacterium]|jgi:cyclic pyranopterin phosphate synthase|nr:cyclic pyranopterin monophosphate synthase MoaC [Kordiimonadaceae bacterium]MBT6134742.1 cyclic pyranopterin monophosphate synthase MoaC [Kordiimonadaceae bacterium]MDC0081077.1 cyclic pyranopterin monophosphate synthase MoaC [Emcibacteraceae bacterium]MDC0111700.1 cyclic pyranopterin monophosphate synthase MoaC [Emcibacteraceae bacterium]MDC1429857.1 cyclic pyranopterin monophosphate synthase MoaC [Emcibacteraceae bacterium]|tara:strand:- start:2794 stop:3270 length:477 start_codon:yes stop_codon:yes gene_type:complete